MEQNQKLIEQLNNLIDQLKKVQEKQELPEPQLQKNPNQVNEKGESEFNLFCYDNIEIKTEELKEWFESGADPNLADNKGWTPFHSYVRHGGRGLDLEILQLFLSHGADPNLMNKAGKTPFHMFCKKKNNVSPEILRLFLEHGANPNLPDKEGQTPFHMFCKNKNNFSLEILQLFLEHEANPNLPDKEGQTPLQLYWGDAHLEVKLFIEHGLEERSSSSSNP